MQKGHNWSKKTTLFASGVCPVNCSWTVICSTIRSKEHHSHGVQQYVRKTFTLPSSFPVPSFLPGKGGLLFDLCTYNKLLTCLILALQRLVKIKQRGRWWGTDYNYSISYFKAGQCGMNPKEPYALVAVYGGGRCSIWKHEISASDLPYLPGLKGCSPFYLLASVHLVACLS